MSDAAFVYVVDDDQGLRESLVDMLSTRTLWHVQAFPDGEAWLRVADSRMPGCVLLDHSMPGMMGLDVLQRMRAQKSPHEVVMLTGEGNITIAVEAMRSGASDFVEKPARFEQLEVSVRSALERLHDAEAARRRAEDARARFARLKPREQDVMMGLVEGHPNKIIAYNLGLSVRTVELYRAALMDRLAVDSVAEILKMAYAANMITP